jgi:UDP-N-acetylmuramoyl-tripeptide--D-alanyl-D-alanine ligase
MSTPQHQPPQSSAPSPPKALWSVPALAGVCDGKVDGALRGPITGISIDTRTIGAGDLFVALRDQRDGHDFVQAAFVAGAAAALVSSGYKRQEGDGCLIRVADPLRALEDAGRISRFRTDAKVVAVTGSVGKTGTKEMLRHCLSQAGATHASEKSYNNHWGVPLTLARMPTDTEYGVFEIGMNHAGEIAPLTRMVAPDVAIITTVEAVHLAHFASVDEIAEAKAEILQGLPSGGTAILNRDNPYFEVLSQRAEARSLRIVAFGRHAEADVRVETVAAEAGGSVVTARLHGRQLTYRIGAPGHHYVMNSLAVVAAIEALGADVETCLAALADIGAPAGRGARTLLEHGGGKVLLIDESYNANPASMAAALANLGAVPRTEFARRIAVLGDMRELGREADRLHVELAPLVAAADVDLVFACGEHMRALFDALPMEQRGLHTAVSMELAGQIAAQVRAGDAVMIKGSLGTNMAPIVKAVREIASSGA